MVLAVAPRAGLVVALPSLERVADGWRGTACGIRVRGHAPEASIAGAGLVRLRSFDSGAQEWIADLLVAS